MNKHKAPPTPTIEKEIIDILLQFKRDWNLAIEAMNEKTAEQAGTTATAKLSLLITKAKTTIATPCPACGHKSLIISAGNWLVCGNLECNDPAAINGTLKATTQKGKL